MPAESTVVYPDRVERSTPIRTVAADEWRAAVVLHGDIDLVSAPALEAELGGHLDAGRTVIRVDARAVEFMDSTAAGTLVAASERCRRGHGSLILTGVPHQMQRLLSVAGLDQILLVDTAVH